MLLKATSFNGEAFVVGNCLYDRHLGYGRSRFQGLDFVRPPYERTKLNCFKQKGSLMKAVMRKRK